MIARLQLLIAAALFSTGGTAVKACGLSGWQVGCLRSAIAGVTLALVLPKWRRGWTAATWGVATTYAATLILFVTANKLTTAANTIFLQSTAPIYLLLLGPWLLKERIAKAEVWMTGAIGLGMAMFFVGAEAPQVTAPDPFTGNVLGAISGVTWAATLLGLRALGRRGDSAVVAGRAVVAGNLVAAVAALPAAWPFETISTVDWGIVVYLGVFQIGLAYLCLTLGVRSVPALEVSLLLLLEPVLSAVWAWSFHGERPGSLALVGGSIIMAASVGRVAATTWSSRRRPAVES